MSGDGGIVLEATHPATSVARRSIGLDCGGLVHDRTPRPPRPPAHCWLVTAKECECRGHQELVQGRRGVWKRSLV